MQVDSILRSPTPSDTLKIGLIDLKKGKLWKQIGTSTAWGWQQGCMLQWIPGSKEEIIWNDREKDHFLSHIYNIRTGRVRTLPKAIYTVGRDGKYAFGTEFSRIQNMRPGYGYPGIKDIYEENKAPSAIGIYKMDLHTGESQLIIPIDEIGAIPNADGPIDPKYYHWFNHLLVSPDNKRLIFLHRYREDKAVPGTSGGGFRTRMFTADVNGKNRFLLDPSGNTSHFIWKGNKHITAWTMPQNEPRKFYEFEDQTDNHYVVGAEAMTENGHNTYVPNTNNQWILNDTYPDAERLQTYTCTMYPPKRK